jgi:hypothetical protein
MYTQKEINLQWFKWYNMQMYYGSRIVWCISGADMLNTDVAYKDIQDILYIAGRVWGRCKNCPKTPATPAIDCSLCYRLAGGTGAFGLGPTSTETASIAKHWDFWTAKQWLPMLIHGLSALTLCHSRVFTHTPTRTLLHTHSNIHTLTDTNTHTHTYTHYLRYCYVDYFDYLSCSVNFSLPLSTCT